MSIYNPSSSRLPGILAFSCRTHTFPASDHELVLRVISVHCELRDELVNVDYAAWHVAAASGAGTADVAGVAADEGRNVVAGAVTGVVGVGALGVADVERSAAAAVDVVIRAAVGAVTNAAVDVGAGTDAVDVEMDVGVLMGVVVVMNAVVVATNVVGVVRGVAGAGVTDVVMGAAGVTGVVAGVAGVAGVASDVVTDGADAEAVSGAWADEECPVEFVWLPSAGATEQDCAAFQNSQACGSYL